MHVLLQPDAHTLFTSPSMALFCRVSAPRAPVCLSHISSAGQASSATRLPGLTPSPAHVADTQPMTVGGAASKCTAAHGLAPTTPRKTEGSSRRRSSQHAEGPPSCGRCRHGQSTLVNKETPGSRQVPVQGRAGKALIPGEFRITAQRSREQSLQ